MNDAISHWLVPKTFERFMVPLTCKGDVIIAVNVPASQHLVSVWRDDESIIQCYRRTDHGKVAMNPDDVERHLMNGSRAARLELARAQSTADLNREVALVPDVYVWNPINTVMSPHNTRVIFHGASENQFNLWLPDARSQVVAVPYSMLRSAWTTVDQRLGQHLSGRLVFADGSLRLESV